MLCESARRTNDLHTPLTLSTDKEEGSTPISSMEVRLLDPFLIPLQSAGSELCLQACNAPEPKNSKGGDGVLMIIVPLCGRSSQRSSSKLDDL
eukprot:8730793-Pyramimonas_sp.AAC.1